VRKALKIQRNMTRVHLMTEAASVISKKFLVISSVGA
jgi:hypothetical protein